MPAKPFSKTPQSTSLTTDREGGLGDFDTKLLPPPQDLEKWASLLGRDFAELDHDGWPVAGAKIEPETGGKWTVVTGLPGAGKTQRICEAFSRAQTCRFTVPALVRADALSIPHLPPVQLEPYLVGLLLFEVSYALLRHSISALDQDVFRIISEDLAKLADAFAHKSGVTWRDILEDAIRMPDMTEFSRYATRARSCQRDQLPADVEPARILHLLTLKPARQRVRLADLSDLSLLAKVLRALPESHLVVFADGFELSSRRLPTDRARLVDMTVEIMRRLRDIAKPCDINLVVAVSTETYSDVDRRAFRYFQRIDLDQFWQPEVLRELLDAKLQHISHGHLSAATVLRWLEASRGPAAGQASQDLLAVGNPRLLLRAVSRLLHALAQQAEPDSGQKGIALQLMHVPYLEPQDRPKVVPHRETKGAAGGIVDRKLRAFVSHA